MCVVCVVCVWYVMCACDVCGVCGEMKYKHDMCTLTQIRCNNSCKDLLNVTSAKIY